MERIPLLLFAAILIASIAAGIPIIIALLVGYAVFFIYALRRGFRPMAILGMSLSGISEARNILIAFALIGMLTATWRCAGTIPSIVCYAFGIVRPSWFLIAAFLINSLISFLTGTSFGSVATMGVICMTMGNALGISPALTGGAILSGIFFGDRCSPVSTSALLVADITKTGIFGNISGMMRTGAVPFAAACIIYGVLSISSSGSGTASAEFTALFRGEFRIGLMPLLPAAVMLVLSLMRMDTRTTMAASIAAAIAVAIPYQGISISSLPEILISGYRSPSPELSAAIDGGGILSMVNVAAIVAISSSYAGIFSATGLLDSLKAAIAAMGRKLPSSVVIVMISIATSMIACNQTLATMLTHQLCSSLIDDTQEMALALENSVIVIAALIPWSIAGSVPLAILSAPLSSIPMASYLFLLPIWMMIADLWKGRHENRAGLAAPSD